MARSAARSRGFMCVPAFTVAPSIAGVAQSGQMLTGSPGTVVRGAVSAREWRRDGVAIAGATNATYVLQAADVGKAITFAVTATNGLNAANKVTVVSAATALIAA
ncbi:hypothetical protein HZY97_20215 [Sphingomonas sp. R-74633]|uniref:hypothetical protein n=1 Tax=Sphingomonas sp. R-74633 TaxID=2751188 RepID=UPI0015D0E97B|nr:hypothetical protein [Sphingomonas sp. R-74633]NYT43111.1 hypothetical protein [Sphingomonas sp. R-74633]